MGKQQKTSRGAVALSAGDRAEIPQLSLRWAAIGRDGLKDTIAGIVASVILIANIVSFGALMFPGALSAGIPIAIWAMLIGGCAGGVWIALMTSLPPIATGIDSPTGTVLVLLSAFAGSQVASAGGSPSAAVQTVMLLFTLATFVTGAVLYGLGACRWGSYFRFVPSCVVSGFLAATGCFLISGGIRMTTGRAFTPDALIASWSAVDIAKLATAVAVLGVLLILRRWVKWAFAVPVALLAMWLGAVTALRLLDLSNPTHGWYFRSLGALTRWSPYAAVHDSALTWPMLARLAPEIVAVVIVALISLITKVSSIEVTRQASGDLDRELRAHGIASLVAAPLGGLTSSAQVGTSSLLGHAGGATRMSGVASAVVLGLVGIANFDLPGLIPIPIVAGLVFYLGYTFLFDALRRPCAQRAWLDLTLAVGIAIICLQFGYLVGVLAGLLCACLLFAMSCARLGVVRRHASRAQFASYVDRSPEASDYLQKAGDEIQLYWLAGYIFFGSSEGVFERIQGDMEALASRRVAYLILDFGMVSGADSSAVLSLTKLRSFCRRKGTILVYCSLSPANRGALERAKFFGGNSPDKVFADLNAALAWCEDRLLSAAAIDVVAAHASFEPWLQRQLGPDVAIPDLVGYLERKDIESEQILYREGEPADTLDLVAAGHLNIEVARGDGKSLRVRRMMTHTVVGEMGFFRHAARSATVSSDGPVTVFTLKHAKLEQMRRERPDLASAFDDFLMRVLADRIDQANRKIAAIEPLVAAPTHAFSARSRRAQQL